MVYIDEIEKELVHIENQYKNSTPKDSNWIERVKLEMKNIAKYLDYLNNQTHSLWFYLVPNRDTKNNFRIWEGYLKIPQRNNVQFDMIIILSSQYPKVYPRAFIEEKIIKYAAGNLYHTTEYIHNNKKYIMICHDHIDELNLWTPDLTIAHFLLREVLVWWNSKLSTITKKIDLGTS